MQTLGGGVAIEAHNDRLGTAELGDRFEDAVGDFHAGGDAAIDIDEHGFDLRVGQYDLQAFGHHSRGCAAADVQEVGGLDVGALFLASAGDGIQGTHDESCAVADHTDLAVQVHVVQAVFAGALFEGVGNDGIHETRPAVMAEGGVVIQGDLGVQGAQLLGGFVIRVADLGERIDFHERGVVVFEAAPHLEQNLCGLIDVRVVEADALCHFGGSGQVEVTERIDVQALDGLRMFLGDFLDFGAAVGGGQHVEVARGAVHGDGHVVFVQDVLGFGYKHAGNLVPVDGHRQDGLGFKNRLVAVMGDLDAAGLTTMTDLDLRLDYAGIADFVRRFSDFMGVLGKDGVRGGNVLFLEQLTRLVFVKIHRSFPDYVIGPACNCTQYMPDLEN